MSNIEKLREAIASRGLNAFLVNQIESVEWTTGFTGSNGFLILTPTDARFVTDGRYTLQAKEQLAGTRVEIYNPGVDSNEFLAKQVRDMGIGRIGFDADAMSFGAHRRLAAAFSGIELVPVEDMFGELRVVKADYEIEKIREACKLADACFEHVLRMIQVGVSEYDIGLDIEFFFRRNGAEIAFAPVVVSGARSALPHGRASEKKLESGDFLTLDIGAKLNGYCSDITRTVVVGQASQRHREIYDTVLRSQMAALEAMRPGVPCRDVDKISREAMGEDGKYFTHGLGHGLGKLVHDAGRLNSTSDTVLAVGQVWTVEPGIYIPGFGGVRIEDDVVVTQGGIENMTFANKDLLVLG